MIQLEIVYVKGGTVAALKLGETEDGHPVVVELGKPETLAPLDLVEGQTEAHGVSYDLTGTHTPDKAEKSDKSKGWL